MGSPWERQSRMAMSRPRRSPTIFPPAVEQASCPAAQPVQAQGQDEEEDLSKLPKYFSWEQQPAGSGDPWAQMAANSSSWGQGGWWRGLLQPGNAGCSAVRAARQRDRCRSQASEAAGEERGSWWWQTRSLGPVRLQQPAPQQLPDYPAKVGSGPGERSVLVIDTRDQRLQSPFQGWVLDEILTNAQAAINVLSDRNLVRSPQQGYHFNLFLMKTLSTFKLTLVGSMTSYSTVPCGAWDAPTGKVLSHKAFQPFRWPTMTESSPTWVDIKVKIDGHLLIHLELRGYRGDRDMAVQLNYVDDCVMEMLNDIVFIPSVTVIVFQGYRVIANSWEVGGRLYAVSNGGVVVALDYPLCHFELRLVASASGDAVGLDADRLEARFYSATDRVDVSTSSVAAPPSWLVVSRVSGPTLIKNASWCRQQAARIECPDQQLQLSQLANIHAHWTAAIDAGTEEETGPRIGAIAVESHPENLHFTCESPLYKAGRHMVEIEALALNLHNKQVEATVVPPILDATSVQPVEIAGNALKSLPAPSHRQAALAPVHWDAEFSMTEPGEAAPQGDVDDNSLIMPGRKTLEERRNQARSMATMTPDAFVNSVEGARSSFMEAQEQSRITIEVLEAGNNSGAHPVTEPRSFGPYAASTEE